MFRDMPDRERPGQLRLRPMPSSAAARSTGLRLRLYPQGRRMGSPRGSRRAGRLRPRHRRFVL